MSPTTVVPLNLKLPRAYPSEPSILIELILYDLLNNFYICKQMEMNERIQEVLNNSGLSASEFSKRLDIQRSRLSHILSGRNNASLEIIKKINDNFPEYTLDWLINGVEKPLLYPKTQIIDKKIEKNQTKSTIKKINKVILFYDDETFETFTN